LNEEIVRSLRGMKSVLTDPSPSSTTDPTADPATELSQLIFQSSLLRILLEVMPRMEFEAKKEGAAVFGLLLRRQVGQRYPAVDYVARERYLITLALKG
jgi:calcium binding protein 39